MRMRAASLALTDFHSSGRSWSFDIEGYDTSPMSQQELKALNSIFELSDPPHRRPNKIYGPLVQRNAILQGDRLSRLTDPLRAALNHICANYNYTPSAQAGTTGQIMLDIAGHMHKRRDTYWQWELDDWVSVATSHRVSRTILAAVGYLLCRTPLHRERRLNTHPTFFAELIFGVSGFRKAIAPVISQLGEWGYSVNGVALGTTERPKYPRELICAVLAYAMLDARSPQLEDITLEVLEGVRSRESVSESMRNYCYPASLALHHLGYLEQPLTQCSKTWMTSGRDKSLYADMSSDWIFWIKKWDELAVTAPSTKAQIRNQAQSIGRWLFANHPEITHPDQWTPEIAAEWVRTVDQGVIGQWSYRTDNMISSHLGKPLAPRTKAHMLSSTRAFFMFLKQKKLIALPDLDVDIDLATPRSIKRLIGPDPRDIKQAVWMKLVWASLNLTNDDCEGMGYPLEFIRAIAVVWTHCGLRNDEIIRLPVGCVREVSDAVDEGMVEGLGKKPSELICILHVPLNKTSTEFSKPVGKVVAEKIREWEAVRPAQPAKLDRKSSDMVHFLFSYRAARVGRHFINNSLIPLLCRKAGVSIEDVPGKKITSHRGRASAATWYYNTRYGMTLEELQSWLGHANINSTRSYVRPSPVKQSKRFAQMHANSYMVEVLVDTDSIMSGRAAQGEPWQFFPLGNDDFCSNPFYAQCPHRMACAKCSFHVPANSQKAPSLRAKQSIQRMLVEMPLDEEERAAAEGSVEALDMLVGKLKDVKTPDGRTPRQIEEDEG